MSVVVVAWRRGSVMFGADSRLTLWARSSTQQRLLGWTDAGQKLFVFPLAKLAVAYAGLAVVDGTATADIVRSLRERWDAEGLGPFDLLRLLVDESGVEGARTDSRFFAVGGIVHGRETVVCYRRMKMRLPRGRSGVVSNQASTLSRVRLALAGEPLQQFVLGHIRRLSMRSPQVSGGTIDLVCVDEAGPRWVTPEPQRRVLWSSPGVPKSLTLSASEQDTVPTD